MEKKEEYRPTDLQIIEWKEIFKTVSYDVKFFFF